MLSQLSTVKQRLGLAESDVIDDALLTSFLAAVSARFERECNRVFGLTETDEEFAGDETQLVLKVYPIISITKFDLKQNETDGWVLQANVDYIIRRGCVISLRSPLGSSGDQGRVTWIGGYVLPGDLPQPGQTVLPADVESAAVEQVAYWYQNRNRLGLVSISAEGGAIQQFAQLDLLPNVKPTLRKYERWRA